ncbi:MAG TPA: glutamate--tRNA ligase, partial [Candidatus Polarisedimenticolaceae bacterium]|nr:glutamate--tRNA ligase [Candidatus Polarisedimenticolaceae bacterium]
SSDAMERAIVDGIEWLGLDVDEGPFFQSAARARHAGDAARLLASGHAYRCFCPPELLERTRRTAPGGGRDYVYPRTCRGLPAARSRQRTDAGEPFAVRFAVPDREIGWRDLVHGDKRFAGDAIEDFILLRSDGSPTYMMSVVSDDVEMRISHVIRGDDHISNTPKQILLYEALERPTPHFAHLPLILGSDRKRLSKRHGAVSLLEYRERGYLPQAVLNFLALLGWSPGDDRQKMTRDELVHSFDLGGVGRAGAIFDSEKLDWLNGQYLNELDAADIAALVRTRLGAAGLWRDSFDAGEGELLAGTLELLKTRARTLDDFVERARPYLDPSDDFPYEAQAADKHLGDEAVGERVARLAGRWSGLADWKAGLLEASLREVAHELGVSAGKLIHPVRLAVTGHGVSPGIFEVLELLGRERSLRRLRRLIERVDRNAVS